MLKHIFAPLREAQGGRVSLIPILYKHALQQPEQPGKTNNIWPFDMDRIWISFYEYPHSLTAMFRLCFHRYIKAAVRMSEC